MSVLFKFLKIQKLLTPFFWVKLFSFSVIGQIVNFDDSIYLLLGRVSQQVSFGRRKDHRILWKFTSFAFMWFVLMQQNLLVLQGILEVYNFFGTRLLFWAHLWCNVSGAFQVAFLSWYSIWILIDLVFSCLCTLYRCRNCPLQIQFISYLMNLLNE